MSGILTFQYMLFRFHTLIFKNENFSTELARESEYIIYEYMQSPINVSVNKPEIYS